MANATTRLNENLSNEMWRACDILRRDNNVGGVMAYTEHLAWLMFLKFLDEEEKKRSDEATFKGETYTSVLQGDLAWDAWAGPEALGKWQANRGELVAFVRGRLLPGLAGLTGGALAQTIARLFSDETVGDQTVVRNVPVCASDYNLKQVIQIINEIHFDRDEDFFTITRFYEDLLARMGQENQIAGEFHTPRSIIRFMVEVLDPQIGETVYDPAAGSAGFLAQAYLWMQRQVRTLEDDQMLQGQTFFGQEKKGLAALLGTMNLVLHGVTSPNVARANTLEEDMRGSVANRYDLVLTNPPFGGKEGVHIQNNFNVKSNATELLFLQHILKKLKHTPNARAAVVVPEGTLFRGGAFAEVKQVLLEDFHLFTVVSLPPGAFAPYSDVKTALLFFRRVAGALERNPAAREQTWYYELPLPEDLKKFSKGSPISDEHFTAARTAWQQWQAWLDGVDERPFAYAEDIRARSAIQQSGNNTSPSTSWIEDLEDLCAREYDLSAHNPHRMNDQEHRPPQDLAADIAEKHERISALVQEIQDLLVGENLFGEYPLVQMAEFLKLRKEFFVIDDETEYQLVTVQLHARGICERKKLYGAEIKTKKQQQIRAGDLLIAEIDAKVGGFGIVPPELAGAIVSSHYFLYDVDSTQIAHRFLEYYLKSGIPTQDVQKFVKGSVNYAAIRAYHFPKLQIPLPPLEEQKRVIAYLDSINRLQKLHTSAQLELDALMLSMLSEAFKGTK